MVSQRESIVDKKSLSGWRGVGVILCSAKAQDHIGVVADGGGLCILHLDRHDILRFEPLENIFINYSYGKALITRPALPPERAAYLSAICLRIHKKQGGKLPFGFGDWRGAFLTNNTYAPSTARSGLTCATFVLSVLELAGYVLFDFETWHHRNEDTAWQIRMVEGMRKAGVDAEHVAAVDDSVDGRRFRPAEVAAGFAAFPTVLTQSDAAKHGDLLRGRLT